LLEGEVLHVQQHQIPVESGCLTAGVKAGLGLFLLVFQPLVLLTAWLFGRGQGQTHTGHVLTVRRSNGTTGQARLEGEFPGAMVTRGDWVSLWGSQRHGVLMVSRGYNHQVGADIVVRPHQDWLASGCGVVLLAVAGLMGLLLLLSFLSALLGPAARR
jgi:hypothetical protein